MRKVLLYVLAVIVVLLLGAVLMVISTVWNLVS